MTPDMLAGLEQTLAFEKGMSGHDDAPGCRRGRDIHSTTAHAHSGIPTLLWAAHNTQISMVKFIKALVFGYRLKRQIRIADKT